MEDFKMKCFGVGRFVRDPVLKEVGETCVCEFSLAVNEYRKINGERKKYTNYFDFVIWDKAAQLIDQYCEKGDLLEFYATARQDKWNDKETGQPRSKVVFRVDNFSFLTPKSVKEARRKEEEAVETTED